MADLSPVVTELREELRTPQAFYAWLASVADDFKFGMIEAKKTDNGYIPGIPDYEATPLCYFLKERGLNHPSSDYTHCYWWDGPQAYSLMLPDWLRQYHKAVGTSPSGKTAKAGSFSN